jgi:glycosyltransferase involved in cell wall biosynthesis
VKKVVFACPILKKPHDRMIKSLEASIPLIKAAGWDEGFIPEVDCPYISGARATMTRKALDAHADVIVYLDYDLEWDPQDLVTLLETEGDVVAGTYRTKQPEEVYMGKIRTNIMSATPLVRESDGAIRADLVPAGFLKVTVDAISKFMEAYPDLCYGPMYNLSVDLFNHGAHKRVWYGEDYAFSRNWVDAGGEIWLVPNLNITHWLGDTPFPGNFHRYMLRQPGGSEDPNRVKENDELPVGTL